MFPEKGDKVRWSKRDNLYFPPVLKNVTKGGKYMLQVGGGLNKLDPV